MALPTPFLDDRHFQDIVDQAKRLIPHYTREWTDHNVSDPGVTLIELFAWMTDMLLYRVNQVPDKNYIAFLDLLGIKLQEPRAAVAALTFYLSAAQPADVLIPIGTEIATARTEGKPAIVFTTERALAIQPPMLKGLFLREIRDSDAVVNARQRAQKKGDEANKSNGRVDDVLEGTAWVFRDVNRRPAPLPLFPPTLAEGDSFMLSFQKDCSNHLLALIMDCDPAGGVGVDAQNPPFKWQAWQSRAARWVDCRCEYDGTEAFTRAGELILDLPAMQEVEFQGVNSFLLRCILTDAQGATSGSYKNTPIVRRLRVEARGGTVDARHAVSIHNEVLGVSDGTAGQAFALLHTPILALDEKADYLLVQHADGSEEKWHEVSDFADSGPDDPHFTLDKMNGQLTFGPSLLQPDGTVYNFGKSPEKGSTLVFKRYQHGGGIIGNVAPETLTIPKSSIPYVAYVTNKEAALGGNDAQSLEDAKLRTPQVLRTRTRAVTKDDYEFLASEVSGVERALCLAPGEQPGPFEDPRPGQVFLIVLPQFEYVSGAVPADQLVVSADLRAALLTYLQDRCLIGVGIEVRPPQYFWISVVATVHVPDQSDPLLIREVQQKAEDALYRYLNPYVGGPEQHGWPFGRPLNRSEIFSLLHRVEYVEYVEDVRITVSEQSTGTVAEQGSSPQRTVKIPRYGLICSDRHLVKVE